MVSLNNGGSTSEPYSISYMLNSRNRSFNQFLFNVKNLFAYRLRAEQTTISTEKMSFSLKLLSGLFMGNPALRMFEVRVLQTLLKNQGSLCIRAG